MSNLLTPIVARYNLFFTLAMFTSCPVSHSSQSTHAVQKIVRRTQKRYQDKVAKRTENQLRALIRHASIASSATSTSASTATSNAKSSAPTICSCPCSTTSSCHAQKTRMHPPLAISSSSAPTLPFPPCPSSTTLMSAAATARLLQRIPSAHSSTSSKSRKSSTATLLSVALTMIFLSLLQQKRRTLRKSGRSLREIQKQYRSKVLFTLPPGPAPLKTTLHQIPAIAVQLPEEDLSSRKAADRRVSAWLEQQTILGEQPETGLGQYLLPSNDDFEESIIGHCSNLTDATQDGHSNTAQHQARREPVSDCNNSVKDERYESSFLYPGQGESALFSSADPSPQTTVTFLPRSSPPRPLSSLHGLYHEPGHGHSHDHGHRRSLSMTHAAAVFPSSSLNQAQQEYEWRRQRQHLHRDRPEYARHGYHYRHYPERYPLWQIQYTLPQSPTLTATLPSVGATRRRSAQELAWDRHVYYQQQQHHEEALAEQKRLKQRGSLPTHRPRQRHSSAPFPQDQESVVRTCSLNRAGPSLSTETARTLGLCRSFTLCPSKTNKKAPATMPRSQSRPASAMGYSEASQHYVTKKSSFAAQESPNASPLPSTLGRKKTLKDLAPSLRSLARRCSARFSRPKSFAGTGSEIILPKTESSSRTGSLSMCTSHMSDFRPLTPGPESSRNQVGVEQEEGGLMAGNGLLPLAQGTQSAERLPIHRRVTLRRSKTVRAPSPMPTMAAPETMENQTRSVSRNSTIRFANGRGLDFFVLDTKSSTATHAVATASSLESSLDTVQSNATETYLPGSPGETRTEQEEQEWMGKHIASLMAKKRKDLSRVRARYSCPPLMAASTACLSPLAVEAMADEEEECQKKADTELDPYERIAFMLVPRTRYEFQPLVVV